MSNLAEILAYYVRLSYDDGILEKDVKAMSDETFMSLAEEQGNIMTLNNFLDNCTRLSYVVIRLYIAHNGTRIRLNQNLTPTVTTTFSTENTIIPSTTPKTIADLNNVTDDEKPVYIRTLNELEYGIMDVTISINEYLKINADSISKMFQTHHKAITLKGLKNATSKCVNQNKPLYVSRTNHELSPVVEIEVLGSEINLYITD